MEYKLVTKPPISNNIFEPVKNSGQRVELARVTSEDLYNGKTITAVAVTSTAFDMKSGDKINIGGQSLTLDADEAASSTSLSVSEVVLTFDVELHQTVEIDTKNLFVQYQRKTEGTIAGMPVDADTLGPITYDEGDYSIIGVDPTYVKILPRDFMVNEDSSPAAALEFKDASNTGLQVGDADHEMIATVNIPYGTSATEVYVWGSVTTKVVEVYEMNVNANGKSAEVANGTTNGSAIDFGDPVPSTATNYLLLIVKVTATSNRIYGGKVTLTQN